MSAVIAVPEAVRRKALAVGADGRRWLHDLAHTVADLESDWRIRAGAAIAGGSGGYVAHAISADGTDAVLKIAIPDGLDGQGPFARELDTLLLGDGLGYVRVLEADVDRRAMLQERLGRPLSELALPVESQVDVIASTLRRAWRKLPASTPIRTGLEQAQYLDDSVRAEWEQLRRPCPERTIERAQAFARARRTAFDAETAVLIHGDAHPANVLEERGDTRTPGRFRLIDPDGMLSEPAHDLAIPLRDWTVELEAAADPAGLALSWCARLGASTGVDAGAIWEWSFVERVSTGLFLLRLGDRLGERFLEMANTLVETEP